jgi:hypothetical protein
MRTVLLTDAFGMKALQAGLQACGLQDSIALVQLPAGENWSAQAYWDYFEERGGPLTHLITLERVGPSHTPESLPLQGKGEAAREQFVREVPAEHHNRCHSMRGRDITDFTSPAHLLVEAAAQQKPRTITIGIGDGGNEIGMGKIAWDTIRRNIPNGAVIACRVPTDYLIVAGVSNWGGYALAAGVALLRDQRLDPALFDVEKERELLRVMVEQGPLVDGVTAQPTVAVDGLSFDRYAEPLRRLGQLAQE